MTVEDKLRFELGYGFKKLSKEKLSVLGNKYAEIYDREVKTHGIYFAFYNSTIEFCYYVRNKYPDDEEFLQAIMNHRNWGTFGWALHQIKDDTLCEYVKKEMTKLLSNCSKDDIEEYLNSDSLFGLKYRKNK